MPHAIDCVLFVCFFSVDQANGTDRGRNKAIKSVLKNKIIELQEANYCNPVGLGINAAILKICCFWQKSWKIKSAAGDLSIPASILVLS